MNSTRSDVIGDVAVVSKVIEALVLITISIVSIVGNLSLWLVVLRTRVLRNITNMFILGLSTADLLVATVNMPLTVYTIIAGNWLLSDSACVAVGFINMLTLVTSVLSLCNISINRFFMVCRPAKFKNIYTPRNAVLMIIATVTCAILLSCPPLLGWSKYVYTPTHSFCFADWVNYMSYAFFMIGCCFGIPFGVMTFCNINIIKSVRESRRKVKTVHRSTMSSSMHSGNDAVDSRFEPEPPSDYDQKDNADNTTSKNNDIGSHESEINDNTDKQIDANHTRISSSEIVLKDNNNLQVDQADKIDFRDSGEQVQLRRLNRAGEIPSILKLDGTTCNSSNTDTLSDDSSNEPNAALITESRRRNQLFSNRSPSRNRKHINSDDVGSHISGTSFVVNEPTLLHPGWRTSDIKADEPSVTTDSKSVVSVNIVSQSVNSDIDGKTAKTKVKARSTRLRRREEIRLAVSLIVVVLLFVICWLPYCISMLVSIFYKGYVPREFHMFTLLIGYANSGCNPIVYGVMNQRFKVGFKKIFCFWRQKTLNLSSSS